jgi:hypothetical protein
VLEPEHPLYLEEFNKYKVSTFTCFLTMHGRVCAAIPFVGTAILTKLEWKKELGHASELKTRWTGVAVDYELLWDRTKNQDPLPQNAKNEYVRITKKIAELSKHDPGFTEDEKLANRCYDEAISAKPL